MSNWDTEAAWRYHNGTKYPDGDLLDPNHVFNKETKVPPMFKRYPDLEPIPLILDTEPTDKAALDVITKCIKAQSKRKVEMPNIANLSKILHFSAGITKRINIYGDKNRPFRAAACTGALYHIELYVVCGDLPGLAAGVYHFDVGGSLRQLRSGDYRAILREASGLEPNIVNAPAILVYSDVFWRNAVKYDAREYRHAFWDCGTILANTLAMSTACGIPAAVVAGFVDDSVNRLLGLDKDHEAVIAMVPVGRSSPQNARDEASETPLVYPLSWETFPPIYDSGVTPAPILDMHAASSLSTADEVAGWCREISARPLISHGQLVSLDSYGPDEISQDFIESVIVRRGSTRVFVRVPIGFRELSTILERATALIPVDFLANAHMALNDIYLIVNAVEGLAPGAYVFHRHERVLEQLAMGDFRDKAKAFGCGQDLAGDASVNIYFMCDLAPILVRFGNRGYRVAQLEASITAGRMYLAAYAQRLGATGLTFFDDDVTNFFSPHAKGKSVMFLLTLGKRARRA